MKTKKEITIEKDATEETGDVVLSVKNLYKSFGEKKVLENFNLELKKGENVVVLGKSGSGKSVLIKCIIGLLKPDNGSINVFGREISKLTHKELDKIRMKIGFLFQSNALYDSMTVRENLAFPLRRHRVDLGEEETEKLIREALANVGLEKTIDLMPEELSGGMRKRVALARTLILKPDIILYDEPTTGLDPVTSREICQLILDIQKKFKTSALIISHDMNCVKITSNHVVVLIDGVCYAQGTFDELEKSDDKKIKQFFI